MKPKLKLIKGGKKEGEFIPAWARTADRAAEYKRKQKLREVKLWFPY